MSLRSLSAISPRKSQLIQEIETLRRLQSIDEELKRRRSRNRLAYIYPEETTVGPDGEVYFARRLYQKQLQFFAHGVEHRERALMAANRVGKTLGAGGFETALHLTGRYPSWWIGWRCKRAPNVLAVGLTTDETRDVMQKVLVGPPERRSDWGTGLIPWECMDQRSDGTVEADLKTGVRNAIDVMPIRHASGGWATLQFRACDQGREKMQGTARDLVWHDEEPPADVYGETHMRTMTTGGRTMLTFTPLKGLSAVALMFLPEMAPIVA
jgi:phage terminase large subunit-like protein